METPSATYLASLHCHSALPSLSEERLHVQLDVPETFAALCKGNPNNAKVLLLSGLKHFVADVQLELPLAYQHGERHIAVDMQPGSNVRSDAKALLGTLKQLLNHSEEFPTTDFQGLVVSDALSVVAPQVPFVAAFSADLASCRITLDAALEELTPFVQPVFQALFEEKSPDRNDSLGWIQVLAGYRMKCQTSDDQKMALLTEAWNALFPEPVKLDASFYSNGGDSIQAIRLLAKMKEQGAVVDLGELLAAKTMGQWRFALGGPRRSQTTNDSRAMRYPLSDMQRRIWSHARAMQAVDAYHEQFLFEIEKSPDLEFLQSCLAAVWNSYDQIRVRIEQESGEWFQTVTSDPMEVIHESHESIESALQSDVKRGFSNALLRVTFLSIGHQRYLLWSHHHVILDGWSVGVLIRGFLTRVATGNLAVEPQPNHQLDWIQTEASLPVHKTTPSPESAVAFRFRIESFNWQAGFAEESFVLAANHEMETARMEAMGITRQVFSLAALMLTARSYDQTNGLYINGISSGRNAMTGDIDAAVGLFIQNISLPVPDDSNQALSSFLAEIQTSLQQQLVNVQRLDPDHIDKASDLLFVYENYPYEDIEIEGFRAKLIHVQEITGFPLTFCVFPKDGSYEVRMVYDARRMDPSFIAGFRQKFTEAYALVTGPEKLDYPSDVSVDDLDGWILDVPEKADIDAILRAGGRVGVMDIAWKDVFPPDEWQSNSSEDDFDEGIRHWEPLIFSDHPGTWRDVMFLQPGAFQEMRIPAASVSPKTALKQFSNFLRNRVWQDNGFQFAVASGGQVYPWVVAPDLDLDLQEDGLTNFEACYAQLFVKHITISSNFLVVLDEIPPATEPDFDLMLSFQSGEAVIRYRQTFSGDFISDLASFLRGNATNTQPRPSIMQAEGLGAAPSILDLFNRVVQAQPGQVAVRSDGQALTFSELNNRANLLASKLIAQAEFESSAFIGIQLPRSIDALVSILGILKTGKAFVPIDVNWPVNRISRVRESASLNLILDQAAFHSMMSEDDRALDFSAVQLRPEAPAYALFTSGSTGIPKGVLISNQAIGNYLAHCETAYFNSPHPGTTHVFTPLTFDFTLTELIGGLCAGCEVVLHEAEVSVYESVKRALADSNCHVLKLTPSHIQLSETEWFRNSTPKTIIVGGEALESSHVDACLEQTQHRLINEYGPTEAAVGCITHEVCQGDIPFIGKPITGMGVAVINDAGKVVSRGVKGELCLFGSSLASGYLNDLEQTDRAFSALTDLPETIAYRTGDLVQMQDDGNLLFLSRVDAQIKLNGYRIESQEIHHVLQRSFGVASHSSVVEFSGGKQLVCFVESTAAGLDYRAALESELPSYMIPQRFVHVPHFPVTANGKLDVATLHKFAMAESHAHQEPFILDPASPRAWLDRPEKWRSKLHGAHLLQNGWERIAAQLKYLSRVEPLIGNRWILGPAAAHTFFADAAEMPQNTRAAQDVSWFTQEGACSATNWQKGIQCLREKKLRLPDSITPVFSGLINTQLDSYEVEGVIEVIHSEALRWQPVDALCVVSNWSDRSGIPALVHRQSDRSFILYFGTFDPESEVMCLDDSGPTTLRDNRVFERFDYRVQNAAIERKVAELSASHDRISCEIIDERIIVFVNGDESHRAAVASFLTAELPLWCQPDEVVACEDLLETIRGYHWNQASGKFEQFVRERLPEFSYLSGEHSLIEQGGDSITALRIIGKLRTQGFQADLAELLNAPNLAQFITDLTAKGAVQGVQAHRVQLTPIQQWFNDRFEGNKNHFNQSILLELLMPVETSELKRVLEETLNQFSILSMVHDGEWKDGASPGIHQFACQSEAEITQRCGEIQASFDLTEGPVAGAAVFEFERRRFLFVSIHHFYCDGYSWRIILDELQAALTGTAGEHYGAEVFGKVHQRFIELGETNRTESEAFFGETVMNPFQSWSTVSLNASTYVEWTWDIPATQSFTLGSGFGNTINEKFLYLFLSAWQALNLPPTSVFFETHGRSYDRVPELSEALGWFTQFYPVFAQEWPQQDGLLESIAREFERLPESGLTYMSQSNWQQPPFPVLLNFLGNFDENRGGIAVPSAIDQGPMSDGNNLAFSIVELNAMITEGTLKWMLRTHPDFDAQAFRSAFDAAFDGFRNEQSNYISADVDSDDLDAIGDLLGDL